MATPDSFRRRRRSIIQQELTRPITPIRRVEPNPKVIPSIPLQPAPGRYATEGDYMDQLEAENLYLRGNAERAKRRFILTTLPLAIFFAFMCPWLTNNGISGPFEEAIAPMGLGPKARNTFFGGNETIIGELKDGVKEARERVEESVESVKERTEDAFSDLRQWAGDWASSLTNELRHPLGGGKKDGNDTEGTDEAVTGNGSAHGHGVQPRWDEQRGRLRMSRPRLGAAKEAMMAFGDPRNPYANLTLPSLNFIFRDPWTILNIPKSHPTHPMNPHRTSPSDTLEPAVESEIRIVAQELAKPWEEEDACSKHWPLQGTGYYNPVICEMAKLEFEKAAKAIIDPKKREEWTKAMVPNQYGQEGPRKKGLWLGEERAKTGWAKV